eukprot:scaffold16620_cov58-Phaeocystis_antarctica.AAC.1
MIAQWHLTRELETVCQIRARLCFCNRPNTTFAASPPERKVGAHHPGGGRAAGGHSIEVARPSPLSHLLGAWHTLSQTPAPGRTALPHADCRSWHDAADCRSCGGHRVAVCQRSWSRQRTVMFGMSLLLSSLAPVDGEVSLVRSHSVMALRS